MKKKLLLIAVAVCVIMNGATYYLTSKHFEKELKDKNKEIESIEREREDFRTDLEKRLKEIEDMQEELEVQSEELQELQRVIDEHNLLISTMQDIIVSESSPKVSKKFAYDLAYFIHDINVKYNKEFGFEYDPAKTLAIIRVESTFNPKVKSYAGAKGLMQLMDRTGQAYAKKIGISNFNPYDWKQNLAVGWYYFNQDKARLGENKATVAYNQGYRDLSGAVSRSLASRGSYLNKVSTYDKRYSAKIN